MPKGKKVSSGLRLAASAGSSVDGTSAPTVAKVFDERPITIPGYKLFATGVEPIDTPTLEQHEAALAFCGGAHDAAPYWIADLMRYAETRADWRERLSQVQDATGLAKQTVENLAYLGRRVGPKAREIAPSPSHAMEVAALPAVEQMDWLQKAAGADWSVKELRARVKAGRPALVAPGACQRCGNAGQDRLIQRWHLSVGDLHERPLLCDSCAPMVAVAVKNALAPIGKAVVNG